MKFLIKFVETKPYADDVMRGSLYMNSLSYFWHVEYGKPIGASNSDRYDIYEGTYMALNKEDIGLDKEFASKIGPNPIVRLSAYKYINLFSTFRAEYNVKSRELSVPEMGKMDEFGKFAVVIMDEAEFRYRIRKKAEQLGYDCIFGDVNYHAANDRGDFVASSRPCLSQAYLTPMSFS